MEKINFNISFILKSFFTIELALLFHGSIFGMCASRETNGNYGFWKDAATKRHATTYSYSMQYLAEPSIASTNIDSVKHNKKSGGKKLKQNTTKQKLVTNTKKTGKKNHQQKSASKSSLSIKPSKGPEGTKVIITSSKPLPFFPQKATAVFYDPGVHGYHIEHNGAAIFIAYDPHSKITYKVPAVADLKSKNKNVYTAVVPPGMCGITIGPSSGINTIIGAHIKKIPPASSPKVLLVSLEGPNNQTVKSAKFALKCPSATFNIKLKADPKKVPADGVSTSTITATLNLKVPVMIVVGAKITKPTTQMFQNVPLAYFVLHFNTDLGILSPIPSNIQTDLSGNAIVTISSNAAGTANVHAQASGMADAHVNVKFEAPVPDSTSDSKTPPSVAFSNNPNVSSPTIIQSASNSSISISSSTAASSGSGMVGSYLGGELIKNWGRVNTDETLASTGTITNQFSDSGDPFGEGIIAGYNFIPWNNNIIGGPFISFDLLNQTINRTFGGGTFLGTTTHWIANAGVKGGIVTTSDIFIYGLGGVSLLNHDLNINFGQPSTSSNTTTLGFTLGIGGELQPSFLQSFGMPVSLLLQFQHTWWLAAKLNNPAASPGFNYTFSREDNTIKLGVNLYLWQKRP